ncbi:DapH/DapD/GlmU-related protein [Fructilactobacillus fructivorans]|uniref:Acetyltransferase (Isoleucine patch superfamily) n=1 Tax=Fructilactobacillus fructivorans TaxID=1614 RepID=A0A0C1M7N9_9LACO|nr:DapH/DapD/GlmU-related protein [Fructilactobacillus fructivorans]KID42489.1 Acetyltransferase (isoleucine patch superfamily) [Fructilactobacillus fructivorans]MCT0151592.1 sugar O-acetyltransferase [Fructilactobacillus fructivorans]MCT2868098.1 sugar O-acetyltransferase [Fructilactobacillus fructivorans]MCT2868595.1 sugar O-acetyltransferase [Fructilactobacillus fructivorans]MCT2873779.1 sugar O-acetyltransferase [Fructilactobacillus fructivorans]
MTSDIFKEALNGGTFDFRKPDFQPFFEVHDQKAKLLMEFNNEDDPDKQHELLEKITGRDVPDNVMVFPPLKTDFGGHIFLKSGVLINTDCLFDDFGGVYLDENVLIGPRVSLITANHDQRPAYRDLVILKPIHIHKNAWIGTGAIILPGVTIGENAIVGAGSLVTKDVPANTTVIGDPAKPMKGK